MLVYSLPFVLSKVIYNNTGVETFAIILFDEIVQISMPDNILTLLRLNSNT